MKPHEKFHILVVEDESDIQQLVSYNLMKAGYLVSCADSGEECLQMLPQLGCHCILLDIMLPGMNGIEICQTLKKNPDFTSIPIIMLTAKGEENDIVLGLESGADDYITKPFSPKVLLARVKSMLRRARKDESSETAGDQGVIRHRSLFMDPKRHLIESDGTQVDLTATEYAIIQFLMQKPGWVFTRQQIIDAVRGYDYTITPRAIDVQIFGLRKKLGASGALIETVRGIGYRLQE
jgi:two-component system alkaline phosphatase synthesis response regulator PhoP